MDQIRTFKLEELEESMKLSQFAFQIEPDPQTLEARRSRLKPEELWGYFVNGRLASQLRLLQLSIWLNGERFEMGGIASVATWPEYRRQGQVGKLLRHSLNVMKERGMTVSMLHPFSFAFYRKYGWEMTVEQKVCAMNAGQLPRLPEPSGHMERLEDPAQAWQLLDQIYSAFAPRYNGMLIRNEEWWKRELAMRWSGTAAVYYDGNGRPAGYVIYEVKKRELKVKDWAAVNRDALFGIWKLIANHDSMADRYEWTTALDDPFTMLLHDPRIEQRIVPYFMGRIVDVQPFLQRFRFQPAEHSEVLSLQVKDDEASWNDGIYRLEVDAHGCVTDIDKIEENVNAENLIICDIQALTSMMFGCRRPRALHAFDKISGSEDAVLRWEARLPQLTSYLADFF